MESGNKPKEQVGTDSLGCQEALDVGTTGQGWLASAFPSCEERSRRVISVQHTRDKRVDFAKQSHTHSHAQLTLTVERVGMKRTGSLLGNHWSTQGGFQHHTTRLADKVAR